MNCAYNNVQIEPHMVDAQGRESCAYDSTLIELDMVDAQGLFMLARAYRSNYFWQVFWEQKFCACNYKQINKIYIYIYIYLFIY